MAVAWLSSSANRVFAQWDVSGNPSVNAPLPFGPSRPDTGGVYGYAEFLFMHTDHTVGHQVVATRGFVDSDGSLTGLAGQFVGSNAVALSTDMFGRSSFTPGFRVGLGYRLEDGTAISVNYAHLAGVKYSANAGPVPPNFNPGNDLSDSFLFQPVYNFSPQFSGPPNKVGLLDTITNVVQPRGSSGSPFGIWNGATTVDETFLQRFDNWDIMARMPVLETDYSRSYALAGGRFAWIWERYGMRTVSLTNTGISGPQDAAVYTNIMSQRMYGPFVGTGNEIYLGSSFALSVDITAAALLNIIKERTKYELGDNSTESKRGRLEYTIVPNVNGSINLWWYPLEGVQIRAGYDLWSFFNTMYMQQPVGFNAGAIDAVYKHYPVRIYHGVNVGVGFSF